jgi:hypothetical protein
LFNKLIVFIIVRHFVIICEQSKPTDRIVLRYFNR